MINIKTYILSIVSVALLFAGILFIKSNGNNEENYPNSNETDFVLTQHQDRNYLNDEISKSRKNILIKDLILECKILI